MIARARWLAKRYGPRTDEVRLVLCGRTADGRVLPVDDGSWDAGITEAVAFDGTNPDLAHSSTGHYCQERIRGAFR